MKLIRLVVCTVVMGSMLNVMAMETEIIQQKRAAAVAKYKETKKLFKQYRKHCGVQTIIRYDFDLAQRIKIEVPFCSDPSLQQPFFDEECIQDLSLIDEDNDSQKEKDKALHRLVRIRNAQGAKYWETLKKSIKTVVQKGADPNLENDTKYAGYPLYRAIEKFNKEKNDDLLQFLFAHGARTNLPEVLYPVWDAFEKYNKNQKELSKN